MKGMTSLKLYFCSEVKIIIYSQSLSEAILQQNKMYETTSLKMDNLRMTLAIIIVFYEKWNACSFKALKAIFIASQQTKRLAIKWKMWQNMLLHFIHILVQ